jgi:recombination protein RecA
LERVQRAQREVRGSAKSSAAPGALSFIASGCTLLDLICGGRGWPLGRIVNIVGDKSTGKTLLAIEACANFAKAYPTGKIWYRETEAAFDPEYAASLGMKLDRVSFGKRKFDTVEDVFEDLEAQIEWSETHKVPGLYIVDSLDALTDREEMKRKIDEASYGTGKARKMSELFRRLVRKLERARICVIIISQVRDNIGVTFGRKTKRTGGRAMDFYASLVIYLAHIETLTKTKNGAKRAVGIRIRAKADKNKVQGPALRECEFPIRFGFGIDDLEANVDWLIEVKRLSEIGLSTDKDKIKKFMESTDALPGIEYRTKAREVSVVVRKVWAEIEIDFLPKQKKYN